MIRLVHRGNVFYSRVAAFAAVLTALALSAPALAQGATAAAIEEAGTPPPTAGGLAQGTAEGGGGVLGQQAQSGHKGSNSSGTPVRGALGAGGAAGTEAQSGDQGSLPFTGYPMTTLAWIVLGLLTAGLCMRLGLFAYQRLRHSEPQAS
jgi:hypothetical protein